MKVDIPLRKDGKASLRLDQHKDHLIKIISESSPFRKGSKRDRAWCVISLFDGLTVGQAHDILRQIEPNIQVARLVLAVLSRIEYPFIRGDTSVCGGG